jgi:hypothetical protein
MGSIAGTTWTLTQTVDPPGTPPVSITFENGGAVNAGPGFYGTWIQADESHEVQFAVGGPAMPPTQDPPAGSGSLTTYVGQVFSGGIMGGILFGVNVANSGAPQTVTNGAWFAVSATT